MKDLDEFMAYQLTKKLFELIKQLERYSLNQRNIFVALDLTIRDLNL